MEVSDITPTVNQDMPMASPPSVFLLLLRSIRECSQKYTHQP